MDQGKSRRRFTAEFKQDAVNLVIDQKYSCAEVARRLGISENNVNRWVRDHRDREETTGPDGKAREDLLREIVQLRQENRRLEMERDILKKAAAFFIKESK